MSKHLVTTTELDEAADIVAHQIYQMAQTRPSRQLCVYAVPRGGVHAFQAVQSAVARMLIRYSGACSLEAVYVPEEADVIVDDLFDSGATMRRMEARAPGTPFLCLFYKKEDGNNRTHPDHSVCKFVYPKDTWLVFPWEGDEAASASDIFIRLLQYVGEDTERGGLVETPARAVKAWGEWTRGYGQDPQAVLKTFEDGADNYDEMVIVHNVAFYTHCEHHLAPFFGTVDFAYIPDKKIVGLSKMPRLIDIFARRLQVQERFTAQIVDAFCQHVNPKGVACLVRARHMCMESRGINLHGSSTTTSALRGVLKDAAPRAEFLSLATAAHRPLF